VRYLQQPIACRRDFSSIVDWHDHSHGLSVRRVIRPLTLSQEPFPAPSSSTTAPDGLPQVKNYAENRALSTVLGKFSEN